MESSSRPVAFDNTGFDDAGFESAGTVAAGGSHRRIVVCCDGTWNTPDQMDNGSYSPTNVVQIARALMPVAPDGITQVVYYQEGVGTFNLTDRISGGAFGRGLMENVEKAYRFLVNNYRSGDEIYLFGFSRGAYTARSLAGLIRNCGIVQKGNPGLIREAVRIYTSRNPEDRPDGENAASFVRHHCHQGHFHTDFLIKFIGVWDTVGALGVPLILPGPISRALVRWVNRRYLFHDVRLSSRIENAYQALALHELRRAFMPSIWQSDTAEERAAKYPHRHRHQRVEQRWFLGVHSNVGGGYDPSGLSNIALNWLLAKATECGLAFDDAVLKSFTDATAQCVLRESRKGFYRLVPRYYRPIKGTDPETECVDESVLEWARKQIASKQSLPKNLEDYLRCYGSDVNG